jgi:hypothetical protein
MCRLLVNNGCNVLHLDQSREKAINWARRAGHQHIVQYLNEFKYESKRSK